MSAQDEALARAKAARQALRLEVNGEPVVTFDEHGTLQLHTNDPDLLRSAARLVSVGIDQTERTRQLAEMRQQMFYIALGAIVERVRTLTGIDIASQGKSAKPEAGEQDGVVFNMPTPKGRAS